MNANGDRDLDFGPCTIRHMNHPTKDGLLTLAGDETCDIPDLTARFVLEAAQLEHTDLPHRD